MERKKEFLSKLGFHIQLGHSIVIYGIGNTDRMLKPIAKLIKSQGNDVEIIKFSNFLVEITEERNISRKNLNVQSNNVQSRKYLDALLDDDNKRKPVIILKDSDEIFAEEPHVILKIFNSYNNNLLILIIKNIKLLEESFYTQENFVFVNNNIVENKQIKHEPEEETIKLGESKKDTQSRDMLAAILNCFPKCYIAILKALVSRFKNNDFDIAPTKFSVQKTFVVFKKKLVVKNKQEYISILKEFHDQDIVLLINDEKEFKLKKSKKFIINEFADLLSNDNFLKDIENFYGI